MEYQPRMKEIWWLYESVVGALALLTLLCPLINYENSTRVSAPFVDLIVGRTLCSSSDAWFLQQQIKIEIHEVIH